MKIKFLYCYYSNNNHKNTPKSLSFIRYFWAQNSNHCLIRLIMKPIFRVFAYLLITILTNSAFAQEADPNNGLKHWMTPEEASRRDQIGRAFVETDPPTGSN